MRHTIFTRVADLSPEGFTAWRREGGAAVVWWQRRWDE